MFRLSFFRPIVEYLFSDFKQFCSKDLQGLRIMKNYEVLLVKRESLCSISRSIRNKGFFFLFFLNRTRKNNLEENKNVAPHGTCTNFNKRGYAQRDHSPHVRGLMLCCTCLLDASFVMGWGPPLQTHLLGCWLHVPGLARSSGLGNNSMDGMVLVPFFAESQVIDWLMDPHYHHGTNGTQNHCRPWPSRTSCVAQSSFTAYVNKLQSFA